MRQSIATAITWLLCWATLVACTTAQAQTPSRYKARKPGSSVALISPTRLARTPGQTVTREITLATAGVHGDLRIAITADASLGELTSPSELEFIQPLEKQIHIPLELHLSEDPRGYVHVYIEEDTATQNILGRNFAIGIDKTKSSSKITQGEATIKLPAKVSAKPSGQER